MNMYCSTCGALPTSLSAWMMFNIAGPCWQGWMDAANKINNLKLNKIPPIFAINKAHYTTINNKCLINTTYHEGETHGDGGQS